MCAIESCQLAGNWEFTIATFFPANSRPQLRSGRWSLILRPTHRLGFVLFVLVCVLVLYCWSCELEFVASLDENAAWQASELEICGQKVKWQWWTSCGVARAAPSLRPLASQLRTIGCKAASSVRPNSASPKLGRCNCASLLASSSLPVLKCESVKVCERECK